jgi:glycosyltransferase involved in cell wall biosynthesis
MLIGLNISNINQKNGIGRVNKNIYKYLSLNSKIKKKFYKFEKFYILGPVIFKILRQLWFNFIFPISLYRDNVDQLICHQRIPLLIYFKFFRKRTNITLILYDLTFIKYPNTMNIFTKLLDYLFVPLSLRLSTNLIVNSKTVKNELIKNFNLNKKKISVLGLAPFQKKKSIPINKKKNYLFVGTIEPRKNLENLILAYSKIPNKIKNKHKLIIVGRYGWGKNNLKLKIKNLNLNKNIKMFENINDKKLAKLYVNSKYLIFPSIYEGFGLPIVESINASTPVICSNLNPMKVNSKNCSLLFNPFNVDSIKNSIKKSENPKLYKILYKNCINRTFSSWNEFVENLVKTLN